MSEDKLKQVRGTITVWRNQKQLSKDIATNIKNRRRELGMTQKTLSELMRTKQPDIARMERISYGRFNVNRLNKLAYYLQTTVSELTAPPKVSNVGGAGNE